MTLEERAVLAAGDEQLKNDLIGEYRNFILSSASKTLKRSVTDSDDEFMTAMIAFNEAIDRYDESKGKFLTFASMVIRRRIIDSIRRQSRDNSIVFSAMEREDDEGEILEFEAPASSDSELKWEIEALTQKLDEFGISFFELAEVTPKSRKTKKICFEAVSYIKTVPALLETVTKQGVLPIKTITEGIKTNKKALERHRKYIITAAIVLTEDYPGIAEYFNIGEV